MLDWLKKLGGKPFQNKVGLEDKALKLLAEDFRPVEKVDADLAAALLGYVLDGESPDGTLSRLTSSPDAAEALGFTWHGGWGNQHSKPSTRIQFFEVVRCDRPEFFVRLGRVYDAATQAIMNQRLSQLPQGYGQLPQSVLGQLQLGWLERLLNEAMHLNAQRWPPTCQACAAVNASLIEDMLALEQQPRDTLVRVAFQPELARFHSPPLEPLFSKLPGFAESAVRHKTAVLGGLLHEDFKQRVYALDLMKKCKVPAGPFLNELVDLTLSSSKQVRELAQLFLAGAKPAARPLVEGKIVAGTSEEKLLGVELLWTWEGEAARPFLHSRLAEEKNKKVLRTIEERLASPLPVSPMPSASSLELPLLPPLPEKLPLDSETQQAWLKCFEQINQAIARMLGGTAPRYHHRDLKPVPPADVQRGFAMLQGGEIKTVFLGLAYFGMDKDYQKALSEFWQRPELQPAHLIRFLVMVGALRRGDQHDHQVLSYGWWMESLVPIYRRTHPEVGLRELGAAFPAAGLESRRLGGGLLGNYQEQTAPFGLPPELIWPYWAEHLELLAKALEPVTGNFMGRWHQRHARRNAFHALTTFPQPPPQLVPQLWELALGPKSERAIARRCLAGLPDKTTRLIAALTMPSAEARFAAADWLGRLGDSCAIQPLQAALKKEKNETAKGGIMSALEQLGVPVEQFLDRKTLLAEAEKGLAKGVPDDLKWFPFDGLPSVHWADNGKQVEPAILKWWLIQGFKLKNPEPGALLRKYCGSIKPNEREALGQFVLDAWVGKDTSPRIGAEAEAEAMKRAHSAVQAAQQWAQWVKQNPQMAQQMGGYAPPQKSLQEHYSDILPVVQREPTGSAIASKGVLSVAAAGAGAGAAPVVGRYLKQWYGMRAAQCRALLQMLVWVEHKTATQLLLAVGSRFRTKGIQEEANLQAQALAERKGWTVAELADRTIPTAGLDDDGVLTLDFGPRQFTAKLNEKLEFALADPDGKPLKSLPDPRKDDDEAKAAEAKKLFSAARKELKSVVSMQRDRFYEAMCTQRAWPFEDWNTFLNRHPIARHHCQRLVWAVMVDHKATKLFRPLPDGSLTDTNDDPVTLNLEEEIQVAHECLVTPEHSLAWRQHFKDYEVEPLFEQFGRPNFDLGEERKSEDELMDFRGHLLEAFKLRGRANKLGYTRGQAQDGGWFFDYHKRFPTLGMEAILEFTGNGLPEENRTVALTTFRFERVATEGDSTAMGTKMSLGEVPAVLLSECWNDLRQIAAEGPGFDPEWEKKAQP